MDTVVFVDSQTVRVFSNDMVLTKINAEVDTAAAKTFAISAYPTLVMVDKDGQEIDRIVGYLPTAEFLKQLDDYAKGIGTLADLLNKAKDKPERQLSYDIAEKYKYRGKPADATGWYQKVIAAGEATDSLAGESRMALADMLRRDKNWDAAVASFEAIMKDFKGTPFGVDAEFYVGYTLSRKGDTAAAIKAYEGFLENNPTSPDTSDVRKRIEKLKNPPVDEKK
jgi:tetratricopeptide (TPR) repeat protein